MVLTGLQRSFAKVSDPLTAKYILALALILRGLHLSSGADRFSKEFAKVSDLPEQKIFRLTDMGYSTEWGQQHNIGLIS